MRLLICAGLATICAACASPSPSVPVQPVTIKIDTFCQRIDKDRDLDWSVHDTPRTINNLRRLGAQWDASCAGKKPRTPTS